VARGVTLDLDNMKLTLDNGSTTLLRSILEAPGWAKTTALIYIGGQLLCEVIPQQDDKPSSTSQADWTFWSRQPVEVEVSEKQFDVCKLAIRHFVSEGKIAAGPFSMLLLKEFKLTEE
jgi:hypothetical protein